MGNHWRSCDRKPESYGKTIWNRLEHVLTEVAEVASIGPVTTVNKVIHLDINGCIFGGQVNKFAVAQNR